MKLSFKRRVILIAAAVLLVLFVLRPGASRLKSRIIYSMSAAVGRPVDIGSVHLRFLPRPGFELESLVVYDDPSFGAEPILRSSEVTAFVRVLSLLRGHIEIAELDLTEPSLNLVHGVNGQWNMEALLERTVHSPLAPTAKSRSEVRPGFPYIEATSARINFKSGPEKKAYALTNADFSLWQESENAWGVRLKAQPFRTDMNLNDTGMLQVDGTWRRAASLRDTPLQVSVNLSRAQLGQLSKLFSGNDQGWRGAVQFDVVLTGTPNHLNIESNVQVDDFRRYDITLGQALRLVGHCGALYAASDHAFREINCNGPVGKGAITLKGEVARPIGTSYDLEVTAESIPAAAVLALIERAKKNLPDDLTAQGTANGSFTFTRNDNLPNGHYEGRGELKDLQLASASLKSEIGPQTIPFALTEGGVRRNSGVRVTSMAGPHLEIGPFSVPGGRSGPNVRGSINRAGYEFSISGESEIGVAFRAARLMGLPTLQAGADGMAQLDLRMAGSWTGLRSGPETALSGPQITGTAKLRNARIVLRGTGDPIAVTSADLLLTGESTRVTKLSARVAGALWNGSLTMPRGCRTVADCPVDFDLRTNQVAFSDVTEWVDPVPKERPWYRSLAPASTGAPNFLAGVRASGRISADHVQLRSVVATQLSAKVALDSGKLQIEDLRFNALGGKHRGEWHADFTTKPGKCSGSGSLSGVSLSQVAQLMNDNWISGSANAIYKMEAECPAQFWSSAEGTFQVEASDGSLTHVSLSEDEESLPFTRMRGEGHLHAGKIEMRNLALDSGQNKYLLSGTAQFNREINLSLSTASNGTGGYAITGTIAEPRVQLSPVGEQARLKPTATK